MIIPEIDRLLDADSDNTQVVKDVLYDYNPDILNIINQICTIYETACRSFSQGIGDHFYDLNEKLKEFEVSSDRELEEKLNQLNIRGDDHAANEALDVLYQHYSCENRGVLLNLLGVHYATAIADFLRMRVTAPFAYLRLQCESLALMKLMRDTPELANQWRKLDGDEDGVKFYKKHQRKIKSTLESFDLKFTYEHTSGTAMHVRFAGIARGLRLSTTRDVDRITHEIRVSAQEFKSAKPGYFIVNVIFFLHAQGRILLHIPVACPEITDEILIETRIPKLLQSVDNQHALFSKKFAHLAERFRQIGLEEKSP